MLFIVIVFTLFSEWIHDVFTVCVIAEWFWLTVIRKP